jgi:hypothetical protein
VATRQVYAIGLDVDHPDLAPSAVRNRSRSSAGRIRDEPLADSASRLDRWSDLGVCS